MTDLVALRELIPLLSTLTIRQVFDAGERAIDASGLNPWCINEGLADGSEQAIAQWKIDGALSELDRIEADAAKLEKAREALKALAFSEFEKDEGLADTQYVWETIYNDRVQDWFGYEEIEAARKALKELSQ